MGYMLIRVKKDNMDENNLLQSPLKVSVLIDFDRITSENKIWLDRLIN